MTDTPTDWEQEYGAEAEAHRKSLAEIERLKASQFTPDEFERLRAWYNALDDIDPNYLEKEDGDIALKILEECKKNLGRKYEEISSRYEQKPDGK